MNSHHSDEELIAQCADGDIRAMDILVSRYHAKLLDFVYRHIYDREAAADITQAALLNAFKAANRYIHKAAFKTWLYTIALNLTRDELRRRRVSKETVDPDIGEYLDSDSPADTALANIVGEQVWDAVSELNENVRTAILLKFRHQMTYEEISAVIGAPTGTVKSWIHHGLRKLRETLRPIGHEG